jgi:hypothetical protein
MNTTSSSASSLTMDALRQAMDRVDEISRPWRTLVGQCKAMPSPWAPPDTFVVADLGAPRSLTDVGFPPLRYRVSDDEPRYMVIGTLDTLASLEKTLAGQGIRVSEVAAVLVYYAQQKHEQERREKEQRA